MRQHVIELPRQMRALASSVRQEIVDTIEALGGEASVAALAAHLGRPSDGLYYHLRVLVRAGLLRELADRGDGRRYRTPARRGERLRLRYHPGDTQNARALAPVSASMLRTAGRDFTSALRDPRVVVAGSRRELWASRSKGWVGAGELAEINQLLERLGALLQRGPGRRRRTLVSLTWVLAPIAAKPARRA
jgi:DNA-binding transcriptional ArsR family regulator